MSADHIDKRTDQISFFVDSMLLTIIIQKGFDANTGDVADLTPPFRAAEKLRNVSFRFWANL